MREFSEKDTGKKAYVGNNTFILINRIINHSLELLDQIHTILCGHDIHKQLKQA